MAAFHETLVSEFLQVPTFRADPLTPKCDGWCEFPVSDRPNAVAQFFSAAKKDPSMIKVRSLEHLHPFGRGQEHRMLDADASLS